MIYERNERGLRRPIGYDVHGEGPAVVFLHPFPFDRGFWSATRRKRDGFRTIAIDSRGFGDSAIGEPGFTIDELADDVIALLDHLGVVMSAIVGNSMGGYVALSLAARHPARVSALVLVDTRAGADGPEARANRDAAIATIKSTGPSAYLDGMAVRLCGRSSSESLRAEVQRLIESSAPDPTRALPATLMALRDRPDRTAILASLQLPTLVMVGTEDALAPPDEARAMARAIPGAERVELTGSGHLPSVETPAAFEAALDAFLRATLLGE